VYRRWWGEHRVDGIVLVDLRVEDPRIEALTALGLPAVIVGGPLENHEIPAVWHDEGQVVVEAVQYLAALGHTSVAHVTGVDEFVHTRQRAEAFRRVTDELGLDAEVVESDYSAESGARATRRLLSSPRRPTAIVFDSDVLAVTGLGVAQRMGLAVPDDVSIIGWDDSLISQVVHPPLTAITRDIEAYGVAVARHLLAAIEREPVGDLETEAGALTARGSTAPPRGRGPGMR
jgi:DNA-binding LacI/PurR family transcriptional regulator